MKKITTTAELKDAIALLENKRMDEIQSIKEQFNQISETYRPLNIMKSAFRELTSSPDLKENVLNTTIGMAAGYLSKKIFIGLSHNPLRKLLGGILQYGMTNIVAKHPDGIKTVGAGIFKNIFAKKEEQI